LCLAENLNAYRILFKKAEGKRPLGRPRRRWQDNKQIDLKTGREGVEYINLSQYSNKGWAVWKRYSARDLKFKTRNPRIICCYANPTPLRMHQNDLNQMICG
jgi:hypothetical protein